MTTLVPFKFEGNRYFYNPEIPRAYWYEHETYENFIVYDCISYEGVAYKAEWRIPGYRNPKLAKRMSKKFEPWDVIKKHE